MTPNRGSFLPACMGLMTLIVIIAFAVLHDVRQQLETSSGNQRYLLAESAARAGLEHAVEQIVTDYNQPTMSIRDPSAPGTPVTIPAVTFLDGPYRAPFVAIHTPNNPDPGLDNNNPVLADDDVRAEDYVLRPWAWWWFENAEWWNSGGMLMYDGKGRYYEPGYYNATPTPPGTVTGPVTAVPFLAANAPLPDRSEGVFYDDQFRRVHSDGGPVQDRQIARYRLRYSVGVEDLSGHLLINPIADMGLTAQQGGTVDYRNPAVRNPWMTGAMAAVGAIAGAHTSAEFGAQLEHVFEGRGYHTNVDFDHAPQGITGWPKTFPLMYRNHPLKDLDQDQWQKNADGTYKLDANGNKISKGDYTNNGVYYQGPGCWGSFINGSTDSSLSDNLFWFVNGTPRGLAAGGEPIPIWTWNNGANWWPYDSRAINHCLMGPQLSFDNTVYAAHGETAYLGTQDGGSNPGFDKFGFTPFGRRLTTAGYAPHGHNKWYQARVDTPFHFNLLTAPPGIINNSLIAYLPPREKVFKYTAINWYRCTGINAQGNRTYASMGQTPIDGSNPANQGSAFGRDLLVDTTAPPAFAPWPAPDRSDANPPGANNPPLATGQYIKPDYYADDVRPPIKAYPGPFMNGDPNNQGEGGDDLGKDMVEQLGLGGGLDLHDRMPFVSLNAGWPLHYLDDFDGSPSNFPAAIGKFVQWSTCPPPAGWGGDDNDYAQKVPDPHQVLHTYSYYFDMLNAMAVALTVFRADYVQYNLTWVGVNNIFAGGQGPSPTSCRTLRDFDRIFLAELGESIDAPGSGWPAALQTQGVLPAYTVRYGGQVPVIVRNHLPQYNIKRLLDEDKLATASGSVTSAQRAKVMELLLNDFRMSFLGSSPDYSDGADGAQEFCPLDFDGDGRAYCSCYADLDGDHLPYAAAGTKPPTYFTVTGNFFIGKSHFYRIFSRGEIWDNLLNQKVDDATLDSVLAVDPEGTDPTQTQFLYQRWFYNRYLATLPHVQR